MAELLRTSLPAGSNVDVKPRTGGVGNPRLVARNEMPLGLSFTPRPRCRRTRSRTPTPVSTVGFPTVLITNTDPPEPIAYSVTRTIIENRDALVRSHAGQAEFDPPIARQPDKVGIPCTRAPSGRTARKGG